MLSVPIGVVLFVANIGTVVRFSVVVEDISVNLVGRRVLRHDIPEINPKMRTVRNKVVI